MQLGTLESSIIFLSKKKEIPKYLHVYILSDRGVMASGITGNCIAIQQFVQAS